MVLDDPTTNAIEAGRQQASEILAARSEARARRSQALAQRGRDLVEIRITTAPPGQPAAAAAVTSHTAGLLVAEGDSWFDYPFEDILEILEDDHGYDVESVAHKGDPVEEMAYGRGQLKKFTRRLEKVHDRGLSPKAILLSGGGNDVAGKGFEMLLNHSASGLESLNSRVVSGIIDQRIRCAYLTILTAVTEICRVKLGGAVPILLHGYDYPVPDGRGFLGGWWALPGPWLEPGFRVKGYRELAKRITVAQELIDRFNLMLEDVTSLEPFAHVRYLDLRNTLSIGEDYRDWWGNELHPTRRGFEKITDKFLEVLDGLP